MISVITGVGSKGQVGEAVAVALARRGDRVILVSRSADEVRARADELQGAGYAASAYGCDLSDASAVDHLVASVRSEHGDHVDALINLAGGFAASGPIAKSDQMVLDRMIAINAKTAYLASSAFFPLLRAKNNGIGGTIVFFASEVVIEGVRSGSVAAYAMSKAAVVALMRSVADEGRELGIRANALAPAAIRTAMNEASMGADARYVEREDVANTVAFLCSPAANAITGQVIRLR